MIKAEKKLNRTKQVSMILAIALVISGIPVSAIAGEAGDGKSFLGTAANNFSDFVAKVPSAFNMEAAEIGTRVRIRPHFSTSTAYNSNATLIGNGDTDSAFQYRLSPGISVEYPVGRLFTMADYTYSFAGSQGKKVDYTTNTHNFSALARYEVSQDTNVGLSNNIQLSETPLGGGDLFILETAILSATHRFGERLTGTVSDTFQWFDDRGNLAPKYKNSGFIDNGVKGELAYDVSENLKVGPSVTWNIRDFDQDEAKNYWQIDPRLQATYGIGTKLTLRGNVGWQYRKFDNQGKSDDNEWTIAYGVGLSYLFSNKLSWTLDYNRSLQDTFDTGFVLREGSQASTLDNLDREYRVLRSDRINTRILYNINEKMSASAYGGVQFIDSEREDNVFSEFDESDESAMEIGASFIYRLTSYLSLSLDYSFGRRFSTDNEARTIIAVGE